MSASDIRLAIVVPAYRARYLRRALASVAAQSDRRFRLYVGDDSSPEALEPIVRSAAANCETVYHRFPENLGGRSLVQQWDRCVRLSREPWVWVFSDDDVMEADCVAAFYRELESTAGKYDLYRFDTLVVNAQDRVESVSPSHPVIESVLQFAYHRLRGERHSTLQELVFSRAAYERVGGFVDFPHAWCSDDAGVILLAGQTGIRTVPGPRIWFRLSGENLTTSYGNPGVDRGKRYALMAYVRWLMNHFQDARDERLTLDATMLKQAAERWFLGQCVNLGSTCTVAEARELSAFMSEMWGGSASRHFMRFMRGNLRLLLKRALAVRQRRATGMQRAESLDAAVAGYAAASPRADMR